MGAALLVAATFHAHAAIWSRFLPLGSEEIGVRGLKLAIAVVGNFVLGALMTLGIGLYAPVHDSGEPARHERADGLPDHDGIVRLPDAGRQPALHPRAGLQPAQRYRAWRSAASLGSYCRREVLEALDIRTVRWLVIVVVLYTAITMLLAASNEKAAEARKA